MGDKVGRPSKLGEAELKIVEKLYFDEGLAVREIADCIGVSHMTVWRALANWQLDEDDGIVLAAAVG